MEQRETECCTPNGQIKRYKDCIGCDKKPLELNQNKMEETLEEAAERISKEHYVDQSDYWAIGVDSFKRGAKWQSERMYSKEEVEQIITQLMSTSPKKWFEQLKK